MGRDGLFVKLPQHPDFGNIRVCKDFATVRPPLCIVWCAYPQPPCLQMCASCYKYAAPEWVGEDEEGNQLEFCVLCVYKNPCLPANFFTSRAIPVSRCACAGVAYPCEDKDCILEESGMPRLVCERCIPQVKAASCWAKCGRGYSCVCFAPPRRRGSRGCVEMSSSFAHSATPSRGRRSLTKSGSRLWRTSTASQASRPFYW